MESKHTLVDSGDVRLYPNSKMRDLDLCHMDAEDFVPGIVVKRGTLPPVAGTLYTPGIAAAYNLVPGNMYIRHIRNEDGHV